jgi:hypothetical protein
MEEYRHSILAVLSPYFRTGWYELKKRLQPRKKISNTRSQKHKLGLNSRSGLSVENRQYSSCNYLTCRGGRGWSGWVKR